MYRLIIIKNKKFRTFRLKSSSAIYIRIQKFVTETLFFCHCATHTHWSLKINLVSILIINYILRLHEINSEKYFRSNIDL